MFKLQRLEITGFKSFADHTEIVFTGSGITAVVGPNGCGKSNVSDAMSWVLGEQRAKSLRGGEMKDVVFAGTRNRKPGGMAEVVLHLVRDDTVFDIQEAELEDIDEALSEIDDRAVDLDLLEDAEAELSGELDDASVDAVGFQADEVESETVKAAQVGSIQTVETKVKTRRHWRPRSFALDFAPGESVSVTRRLYLSGESEYQLNGKTCRLRDITDLFAGTGLSGAHYAIIEQGRIGQILSAKPADRRNLIEEAAGISKFRARQRAAESRLDSAKSNLGRIGDIVSEIEKQVNGLRRQAAKTRRFKVLQEEFRTLLRQLYAAEGRHLTNLSVELRRLLAHAITAESDLAERVSAKEQDARDATHTAREAEEKLAELRRAHAENALQRDRAERDHAYKSDQIVNLSDRADALRSEISASQNRLKTLTGELDRLKNEETREAGEYAQADSALRESEDAYRRDAENLAAVERSIETLRASFMQHTGAFERFDEISRQIDSSIERALVRAETLEKEGLRAAETYEQNVRNASGLAATLDSEDKKLAELSKEKAELSEATDRSRKILGESEAIVYALQSDHLAKKHRLSTLQELDEKKAVYRPQVQKLFAAENSLGVKLRGVLADRMSVAHDVETAVETLFGSYLEAVIVDSLEDARRVSNWLADNSVGRIALLVLPQSSSNLPGVSESNNSIAAALGLPEDIAETLRQIFPREMAARITEDLSAGLVGADEILVDYNGDLLIGGRMLISGKQKADGKNESLLAFKRELKQLGKDCNNLESEIAIASKAVDNARAELVEFESKTVDLQSLLIKVDRGIHGMQIQARAAQEDISRAERHRKVIADEAEQIRSEIADLERRRADADTNKSEAERARIESQNALDKIGIAYTESRSKADEASAALSEKRMIAATSEERRRSATSTLKRVENEIREIQERLKLQTAERSMAEEKIASLRMAIDVVSRKISATEAEIGKEAEDLTASLAALSDARQHSDASSQELAELNRHSAEARNERAAIEIRQAEAETQLKNVTENCQQELNLPLPDLLATVETPDAFDLSRARSDAYDLRNRLENFGAINMLALEELGEAEERHLFLTSQKTDIIDSISATEEALKEIKQRSREKFKAAFEAINENFIGLFQELFGGGRGEMTLLESDDVLEAGIEVVAQPPGKRLQNILLLSGGEKAMTAIALVLAIFKYRPSPFCLLDEVDAPLDDANVGRFAAKIAEMSERTQFIVITHNKRTMEAARALYGVTMQDAGISRVVSVKFD